MGDSFQQEEGRVELELDRGSQAHEGEAEIQAVIRHFAAKFGLLDRQCKARLRVVENVAE